jgi:rubrerythrin
MNIFDYAIELEEEGQSLYNEYAKESPNIGIAKIFTWLAEEERRHYEIFKRMKNNENASLKDTSFISDVKGVFSQWKQEKGSFNFDISQADLYRKALEIEQKSIDFYLKKRDEVKNEKQKELLAAIALQEKIHKQIIENIIEFVTKPDRWVEHAMFTHIGEEY